MYILKVEEDTMTIKNVITQEPFYIGCGFPYVSTSLCEEILNLIKDEDIYVDASPYLIESFNKELFPYLMYINEKNYIVELNKNSKDYQFLIMKKLVEYGFQFHTEDDKIVVTDWRAEND